jgi:hypothetical protein
MRTKTLLLAAAAALAAGILSSSAQVYSANVVGYVNIPLTNGVLTVVAPALDFDGTGTNNTISTVFPTNGVSAGDTVYVFNGAGFDAVSYFPVNRSHSVAGWYLGSTLDNTYPINPGECVFYSPAANETNTQVGTVLQGTNLVNTYLPTVNNIGFIASDIPLSGGITTTLQYQPSAGDTIYQFNGAGYNAFSFFPVNRSHSVAGWYNGSTLSEPQIPVGSGFWFQSASSTNTWVQNFIVQ